MHAHEAHPSSVPRRPVPRTPVRTRAARASGLPLDVRALQATAGNAAVVQLLRRDGAAQEAAAAQPGTDVRDVLRSPGRPLDPETRADMEARLGADFSDVRVHDDSAARASAAGLGARAYTSGNHVVLGDGGTDRHTLAHELTHVVQQRQGPVAGTDNGSGLRVSDPSDRFEREAEATATRALAQGAAPLRQRTAPPAPAHTAGGTTVQRFHEDPTERVRFTANARYAVSTKRRAYEMWVLDAPGVSMPHYCERTGQVRVMGGQVYYEVKPKSLFYADCLHSAEEIMHDTQFPYGDESGAVRSRVRDTGTPFGVSDDDNIAAANEYKSLRETRRGGNKWNTDERLVGRQAFVIVETQYKNLTDEEGNAYREPDNTLGYPYHAAAVVAEDGPDRITVEVLAGIKTATKRKTPGHFDIYQIGGHDGPERNFHARWKRTFKKPVTLIVEVLPPEAAPHG